jgi:putative glycosyltransferase (TIGR04372 family)
VKAVISRFLTARSPIRERQYPSRSNTIKASLLMLAALPLAPFLTLVLAVRRGTKGRFKVLVVDIDNEFGHFVEIMERTRVKFSSDLPADVIVVLSRFKFAALASLYERAFQRSIWFGGGLRSLWLQLVLLQPGALVEVSREGHGDFAWMREQRRPLTLTDELIRLREDCLQELGCHGSGYVTMAVYSMQYDEERAPAQVSKTRVMESDGEGLAPGVDYLRSRGMDVIMLGSSDLSRSRVPRDLPRLSEFGSLGGPHEVALASGCKYFWTDSVGAWWLALPFDKPVLCTNSVRLRSETMMLVHFVRYRTPAGAFLTWRRLLHREIVEKRTPMKDAAKGKLIVVKNSPQEIVAVHQEMLERVAGTYVEDAFTKGLRSRFSALYEEFGQVPPQVSGTFLRGLEEHIE